MTKITTGCPRCGRVELEVDDLTLVVSPHQENAWYVFDCCGCAEVVVKAAPTTIAVALTRVQVRLWTVPAEVLERVRPGEAGPVGIDDVLDALLVLNSGQDLVRLATGVPPGPGAEQDTEGRAGSRTVASGDVTSRDVATGGVTSGGGVTSPSPGAAGSRPAHPNAT